MKRSRIDRYSAVMLCLLAGLYMAVGVEWLRPGPRTSIVRPRLTATGNPWEHSHLRDRIASVRLHDVPLEAAIGQLRSQTGATIDVNWKALQSAGVSRDSTISAQLVDVELATALRVILNAANRDLEFGVLNGGTIVITYDTWPSVVIYDIRGLIPPPLPPAPPPPASPVPAVAAPSVPAGAGGVIFWGGGIGAGGGGASAFTGTPPPPPIGAPWEAEEAFAGTIAHFLDGNATSLRDDGPRARVDVWAHRLIVTGSPEVHRDVEDMLRQVRETDRK